MIRKIHYILFLLLLSSLGISAQSTSTDILDKVFNKTQKVKDYSVDANIKVDMPFIRMLPIDVKIYFKQKDKFHVESKSIAIVPRQGFHQASNLLADKNSFTSVVQGTEKMGNIETSIVNVIPLSDTSDIILGKLWIDTQQNVIVKSQLTTRSSGTILTQYFYGSQIVHGLPDKMIFTVDVKKFRMPKSMAAEMNKNASQAKTGKEKEAKKGNIVITFKNYQINKGISDSVFKK